jgi:hypothetical protein
LKPESHERDGKYATDARERDRGHDDLQHHAEEHCGGREHSAVEKM